MAKLKLKTHRGAAKRFKKTATGKIKRHRAFARHIFTSKSPARKRRLHQATLVDPADAARVLEMLPY
ncbi:MAG: 50S ribosomal protein L35 [Pseudomonadota bacterium]